MHCGQPSSLRSQKRQAAAAGGGQALPLSVLSLSSRTNSNAGLEESKSAGGSGRRKMGLHEFHFLLVNLQ
jgi:hypothetical protein